MIAYDYNGAPLNSKDLFYENTKFSYGRVNNTNYTIMRIFKKRLDGNNQYPFVRNIYIPYQKPGQTAYELANSEGWFLVTNGGIGDGLTIENGVVITDKSSGDLLGQVGAMPLTINTSGDLGYVDADTTGKGAQIVNSGVVSAVCGFFPIIDNYENFSYPTDIPHTFDDPNWVNCQRNVIGQFENGDYCIITGEGRNYANSVGFTIPQLQDLCKSIGLKFAYDLDGGGSTQSVLGKKLINHAYEGTTGRTLATAIVFNGKNTYQVPNS